MVLKRSASVAAVMLCVSMHVWASPVDDQNGLLPIRDQNPFVLGSGLPLQPEYFSKTGQWSVDASVVESNTQWRGYSQGASSEPPVHLVYGAETREVRATIGYAFAEDWNARVSIGDEWIGVGFLDNFIQHFHRLIGAPNGYRGGRLGAEPPIASVTQGDQQLYLLDRTGSAVAPLLVDVAHTWNVSDRVGYGVSLGAKFAVGDTDRLSDTGDTGVSVSAFGHMTVFDSLRVDGRVGLLHASGNDVLPTLARSNIPFGDVSVRGALFGGWDWQLQYGTHAALYRDAPAFLRYAGLLTIGLSHDIGSRFRLMLGLTEDFPIDHTQDVSFVAALRYRLND
jgi:Protein of unknown function (DUF3187)